MKFNGNNTFLFISIALVVLASTLPFILSAIIPTTSPIDFIVYSGYLTFFIIIVGICRGRAPRFAF